MRLFMIVSLSLVSNFAFAHGEIELFECFNSDSSKIMRAENIAKGNFFNLIMIQAGKKEVLSKKFKIALTDTVEKNKVIENIKFTIDGKLTAHLKILETPMREIRMGEGRFTIRGESKTETMKCAAVY